MACWRVIELFSTATWVRLAEMKPTFWMSTIGSTTVFTSWSDPRTLIWQQFSRLRRSPAIRHALESRTCVQLASTKTLRVESRRRCLRGPCALCLGQRHLPTQAVWSHKGLFPVFSGFFPAGGVWFL
jgi:hypothetical protein